MEVRYVVGLIVLILTIVSLRDIIFDKLLSSREKNKMYENYTHNTLSKKIDLDVVLSDYNKSLTEKKIDSIHKNESFGKGSFTSKIREEVMPTINKILNKINTIGHNRLKFIELDRIEKLKDKNNNIQYIIGFFVHSVDTSVTTKLILNYYISNDNVYINSLRQQSKTEIDSNKDIISNMSDKQSDSNQWRCIDRKLIKKSNLDIDSACKFTLNIWNKNGANKELKLNKNCTIVNNSQMLQEKMPYDNPTIFSPMFQSPIIEYNTD